MRSIRFCQFTRLSVMYRKVCSTDLEQRVGRIVRIGFCRRDVMLQIFYADLRVLNRIVKSVLLVVVFAFKHFQTRNVRGAAAGGGRLSRKR